MNERFVGKVTPVTGGASGIGLAARRIVGEGGRGARRRGRRRPGRATKELGDDEPQRVVTDVTAEADVEAAVAAAVEGFGRLDIAVNAAGIGTLAPIQEHPVEELDRILAINLKGVFLAVKHESKAMITAGTRGAILNIALAQRPAARRGDGRVLRVEGGRVDAHPGGGHGARPPRDPGGRRSAPAWWRRPYQLRPRVPPDPGEHVDNTPMGRVGTVDDIAGGGLLDGVRRGVVGLRRHLLRRRRRPHAQYPRFFDLFSGEGAEPGLISLRVGEVRLDEVTSGWRSAGMSTPSRWASSSRASSSRPSRSRSTARLTRASSRLGSSSRARRRKVSPPDSRSGLSFWRPWLTEKSPK